MISQETFAHFFAFAPWVVGIVIFTVAYLMVRNQVVEKAPIGQTFACATCGRRGIREHMLPQAHAGAVSWFCSRCAGGH
ncbi:MAG: hypothetical protein M3R30_03375 [Candidatus Eremiobacteraeota bacterium]|nr:hypothetical protein [Candidatus Eremiobacteraeota bacterium]